MLTSVLYNVIQHTDFIIRLVHCCLTLPSFFSILFVGVKSAKMYIQPSFINILFIIFIHKGKGKGKAIPLQTWTGPEGSRKLRLPNFKTIST